MSLVEAFVLWLLIIAGVVLSMSIFGKQGFWGKLESVLRRIGVCALSASLAVASLRSSYRASREGIAEALSTLRDRAATVRREDAG